MALPLAGTVALVTGASRGIGRGIAVGLAEAGATLYITGRSLQTGDSRDPVGGSLQETARAVETAGGVCFPVPMDHSDDDQVRALFSRIAAEQDGRLEVLVNNVYGGVRALRENAGKPFWEADPGLWEACNGVGLRSHYLASVLAAPLMIARGRGLICTISSWGGLAPIFGVAYGVGKSACDRLAADMAADLRPHGVASIALWPGVVGTEHIREFVREQADAASPDPAMAGMASHFNWETPLFTGRVIAALAADPQVMRRTGKVQIVAELAAAYGLVQEDGTRPVTMRSLRFLLPFLVPRLQSVARWLPDLRIPWWLMLLTALSAPRL